MRRMLTFLVLVSTFVVAQDLDWVREWERARRRRPANVPPIARIAPPSEPGTPLIVHGRVLNGSKSAPNVVVFAYQADRTGVYNHKGQRGWRLQGWARSDAQGRFEFRTIRPGSYPRSANPAHIHVTIDGPGVSRRWTQEIEFADDPLIRDKSKKGVLPVTVRNGAQHVNYTIQITEAVKF